MIFQFVLEPVLIQQILIGFEAILEIYFRTSIDTEMERREEKNEIKNEVNTIQLFSSHHPEADNKDIKVKLLRNF